MRLLVLAALALPGALAGCQDDPVETQERWSLQVAPDADYAFGVPLLVHDRTGVGALLDDAAVVQGEANLSLREEGADAWLWVEGSGPASIEAIRRDEATGTPRFLHADWSAGDAVVVETGTLRSVSWSYEAASPECWRETRRGGTDLGPGRHEWHGNDLQACA